MIEEYMRRAESGLDDAIDYVDQGIVRWIDYFGPKAPVIIDSFYNFDDMEE